MRGPSFATKFALAALLVAQPAEATCPTAPRVSHDNPSSPTMPCACFVPGEQAGVIFSVPKGEFPIEILEVGIGWSSQFTGGPTLMEQAIHIYAGGLPDPGTPIFSKPAPFLVDGITNVFDLEPEPGQILVHGGPITVTLEFLNQSAGGAPFAPSVIYDTDGCQPGKNVAFAQPGGWADACLLGVPGDWVFWLEYWRANCRGAGGLTVSRASGNQIRLDWSPSCLSSDTDYDIYEGFLSSAGSHTRHTCSTSGNTMATISPASGDTYYIITPTDDTTTGSYGIDSSGAQRLPGSTVCTTQQLCP